MLSRLAEKEKGRSLMTDQKAQNPARASEGLSDSELAEMIAKAIREPGVQEAMKVYESWRRFEEAARPAQQAMNA
jgi:hypothetical protein